MSEHKDTTGTKEFLLSVWVLEDYDTEEWVLKHDAKSLVQLFRRTSSPDDEFIISRCDVCKETIFEFYYVVAIHLDRSLVFFFQRWNRKLVSSNMDSKEVCALHTLGDGYSFY